MDDPPGLPDSYWAAKAAPGPPIPALDGSETADVVVVGAGYTGLSAALHLAQRGAAVLVVDAHEPGWGASGRNNGQVVAALKHEPHEIERRFGMERGGALIDAIGGGPDLVLGLIERYRHEPAKRAAAASSPPPIRRQALAGLQRRVEIWNARGVPLTLLSRQTIAASSGTDAWLGGCLDPRGGAINPLGYARGLAAAVMAEGGAIRRRRPRCAPSIARIHSWQVTTDRGGVDAAERDHRHQCLYRLLLARPRQNFPRPRARRSSSAVRSRDNIAKPILPGGQIMSDTRYLTVGVRMHEDGRLHLGGGNGTAGTESDALYAPLARHARCCFRSSASSTGSIAGAASWP